MPGSKSITLSLSLLDHVLGGGSYARATNVYVALFTATPTSAGGGTEVSGGSYARVALTNNSTNFPAAAGSTPTKSNGAAVTYPSATVSWGTVNSFALFDASSGGNMLYWGPLTASRAVNVGDTPSFAVGALTITES